MVRPRIMRGQRVAEAQQATFAFRIVMAISLARIFQPRHWTQIVRAIGKAPLQFDMAVAVGGPAVNPLIAAALRTLWPADLVDAVGRLFGLARWDKWLAHKSEIMARLAAFCIRR